MQGPTGNTSKACFLYDDFRAAGRYELLILKKNILK
jgi:hypothetical protein